eukprot:ANDGO_01352.mRNA.1 hypothetical protein
MSTSETNQPSNSDMSSQVYRGWPTVETILQSSTEAPRTVDGLALRLTTAACWNRNEECLYVLARLKNSDPLNSERTNGFLVCFSRSAESGVVVELVDSAKHLTSSCGDMEDIVFTGETTIAVSFRNTGTLIEYSAHSGCPTGRLCTFYGRYVNQSVIDPSTDSLLCGISRGNSWVHSIPIHSLSYGSLLQDIREFGFECMEPGFYRQGAGYRKTGGVLGLCKSAVMPFHYYLRDGRAGLLRSKPISQPARRSFGDWNLSYSVLLASQIEQSSFCGAEVADAVRYFTMRAYEGYGHANLISCVQKDASTDRLCVLLSPSGAPNNDEDNEKFIGFVDVNATGALSSFGDVEARIAHVFYGGESMLSVLANSRNGMFYVIRSDAVLICRIPTV